ncbi:MAG: DMT family transporter, partial [Anaerolineaceae bacterium]
MDFNAILFILLLGTLFGGATLTSRFCLQQFDSVTFTAFRFLLAALVYMAFYVFRIAGKRLPTDPKMWKHAAITGLLGNAIPATLIVTSLGFLSSGLTSTLVTIFPVTTVVAAHFLLRDEPLTWRKIAGVLVAFSGAFLIVALGETGLPDVSQVNPFGYSLIFLAALSNAANAIYMRKYMMKAPVFEITSLRLSFAAVYLIPLAFAMNKVDFSRVDAVGWLVFALSAVILVVGIFLAFYVIQRFGVTIAAMVDYVPPVISSLGGAWLLGETVTPGMLAGMALIFVGVLVINLKRSKP